MTEMDMSGRFAFGRICKLEKAFLIWKGTGHQSQGSSSAMCLSFIYN